jgi:predicted Ser/Thr protein kinase
MPTASSRTTPQDHYNVRMQATPDELPQQLILDRYRPLEDLGAGGYGSVVLAWDTRIQRRVAIKRLPLSQHARRSRSTRDSGLAEARMAAMLTHQDIVTVYEWDTDSDEAFLIMEFVDGVSLADLLDSGGPLDDDEAAAVLDAVFSAVEFAHENGVLHLDLKPANVLVARDGRVKVADFGVSTLSSAMGHGSSLGGTLGYMPPEQLRGETVDERTDVWALGALAFEVLANANPYVSDSVEGSLFKAEVAEPAMPSDFERGLSGEIDTIVATALAGSPGERYPSVTHFASSLLPLLGDERMGRANLADRVAQIVAEEPDEHTVTWDRVGLWDRGRPFVDALARVVAAAATAWLAWAGLSVLGLGRTATIVGAGLAALAGALAPALGVALGLAAFSVGLFAKHAYVTGALLVVLGAAYWWFVGRRNRSAALLPLAAPVLGMAHLSLATPFLAGFMLPPLQAALAALAGGALTVLAWATAGGGQPFASVGWRLLIKPWAAQGTAGAAAAGAGEAVTAVAVGLRAAWTSPFTYVALVAWAVAAVAMSLACRRASRPAAFLGTAIAAAVLWGGYALAGAASALFGAHAIPALTWAVYKEPFARQMTASLILVVLVVAAGPPVRPEEE